MDENPTVQVAITQLKASLRYGVSDRTIRRWERQGLVAGTRTGGHKLYSVSDLDRLVTSGGNLVMDEAQTQSISMSPRRHPDLFNKTEALEYLHRPGDEHLLDTLRQNKQLVGWKLGKEFMYHRDEWLT